MQQWDNSRTFPKNTQCVPDRNGKAKKQRRREEEAERENTQATSKTQGKGMKGNLSPFLALPLSHSLALLNVSFYACFLSKAAAKFQCIQLAQWD